MKWVVMLFWSLKKQVTSKSIVISTATQLVLKRFFSPVINLAVLYKAFLKPLTKLYKPRAYKQKLTEFVIHKNVWSFGIKSMQGYLQI